MNPLAFLAAIPSIAQLFGGGPQQANYSPAAVLAMMAQYYKGLLGGPIGESALNNATIAGNLMGANLTRSLASSGLSSTGLGSVAGAGAGSFSALNRQQVLADLMKIAQGLTSDTLAGQTTTGQFAWQNPSGFRAAAGSFGTSLWPLLLKSMDASRTGNQEVNWGAGGKPWWFNGDIGGTL